MAEKTATQSKGARTQGGKRSDKTTAKSVKKGGRARTEKQMMSKRLSEGERVTRVVQGVSITNVRLVAGECNLYMPGSMFESLADLDNLEFYENAQLGVRDKEGFLAWVFLGVRLPKETVRAALDPDAGYEEDRDELEDDEEEQPPYFVRAFFELRYDFDDDFKANKKDVESFIDSVSVFQTWPYWREFVDSMTARMGGRSVVIPLKPVLPQLPE